jgi:hypothetical protein
MVIFKNMVLGKMFGTKWEEVTYWRESGTREGGKKFIHNFDGENFWKETTWNTKVQMAQ